jgi:hypothetical protein
MKLVRFGDRRAGLVVDLKAGPHIIDVVASVGALLPDDPISNGVLNGILKDAGSWAPLIEHWPRASAGLRRLITLALKARLIIHVWYCGALTTRRSRFTIPEESSRSKSRNRGNASLGTLPGGRQWLPNSKSLWRRRLPQIFPEKTSGTPTTIKSSSLSRDQPIRRCDQGIQINVGLIRSFHRQGTWAQKKRGHPDIAGESTTANSASPTLDSAAPKMRSIVVRMHRIPQGFKRCARHPGLPLPYSATAKRA